MNPCEYCRQALQPLRRPLEASAQRWVCLSLPSSHQPPAPTSTSALSHPSACLFYSNTPLSHRGCPGFRWGEGLDAGLMRAEQSPSISLEGSGGSRDDGTVTWPHLVAGQGQQGSPTLKQVELKPVGPPHHNSERGPNTFFWLQLH